MDFQLSVDQEDLRASVRTVLDQSCSPSVVRQVFAAAAFPDRGDAVHDPRTSELWQQMTKLDWPALAVPEEFGGLGLGFVELGLVVEELGRAVAPTPYVATVTQFVPMVRECASPEQAQALLPPVAEGRVTGSIALAEPGGRWELAAVATTARRNGRDWVIDGRKSWVLDGATADQVAVVARAEATTGSDGLGVFVVPAGAFGVRPLKVMDPSQPLAELTFEAVAVPAERVLVEPGDPRAAGAITRAVEEATAALATGMAGTTRSIFDMTLQYTKDREQFGRPIGSFQALKHRLVNMYCSVERASALASFAALTIAEDDERRSLAVSMAKAAAGEAQRLLVQDSLQLHGGVGFTWEHDLHLYMKRAKSSDFLFGNALVHRARVARLLGLVEVAR